MRSQGAARRYARAIFQLAGEEGRRDETVAEIDGLAKLLDGSDELADVLYRPLHPMAERRAAFDAVAGRIGLSATVRRFVEFLLQQHRMRDFRACSPPSSNASAARSPPAPAAT